jgi:hypothetical protein
MNGSATMANSNDPPPRRSRGKRRAARRDDMGQRIFLAYREGNDPRQVR